MNIFRVVWQKTYMFIFYKFTYLMNWRLPEVIKGENSLLKVPSKMKELELNDCLLVIDPGVLKIGLADKLVEELSRNNISYFIFDKIEPNPKIRDIELGVKLYNEKNLKCMIGFGGGSALDTAKAIGARVVNKNKSIEKLGGLLKVRKKIPPLFLIPTTAGTGSEATIASVVTNEVTHHKYAINDLHLIPDFAVLDPLLTVGLPKTITAQTGMDALTHAVEGYLAMDVPKEYQKLAIEAIASIFNNILLVFEDGTNIEARKEMLYASFKAGAVFTRVGLTYVHPIAHTLGGLYNIPHGLANAVVLPYCLRYYGDKVYKKLSFLSEECLNVDKNLSIKDKANIFVDKIDDLNNKMELTRKFEIKENDIPTMVNWAIKEADNAYNPPVILDKNDLENIIRQISK